MVKIKLFCKLIIIYFSNNNMNSNEYVSIINGAILTDLIVIILILSNYITNKSVIKWYRKFNMLAFMLDVLSIALGIIIAKNIYYKIFDKYLFIYFLILVILIQLTHDSLFGMLIYNFPKDKNQIIDVFKEYSDELSYSILFYDALMMILAVLISSFLVTKSFDTNIKLFLFCLYLSPYLLFSV